jgi:predicted transcriptional regulator
MAKHEIKRLPVIDHTGQLVGVVSRIDILCQVIGVETNSKKFQPPSGALQTVQQVMYPEIPIVSADTDLATIVAVLVDTGMRRLIVVDQKDRPIGLISDSDVVSRIQPRERRGVLGALRGGPAPAINITAEELMSPGVLTARVDMPLIEAAKQMLAQQRKWLVVVDEQGKTLGLVDRQILLKALTAG